MYWKYLVIGAYYEFHLSPCPTTQAVWIENPLATTASAMQVFMPSFTRLDAVETSGSTMCTLRHSLAGAAEVVKTTATPSSEP